MTRLFEGPQDCEPRIAHLTWDQAGARLANGAPAILPVGAASKQHGLHLPMNTDQIQAEWLAGRVAAATGGLIWPAVTYGHYPAFSAYAGSLTLTADTFEKVISEIAQQLLHWSRSHVIVVDTGYSTNLAVARAIAETREPSRCLHLKAYDGAHFRHTVGRIREQPHGSHADEIETSIMLALMSNVVDMDRARASPALPDGAVDGPLTSTDPASPNYSPSGSFGSPQFATLEKGQLLLAAMEADALLAVKAAISG